MAVAPAVCLQAEQSRGGGRTVIQQGDMAADCLQAQGPKAAYRTNTEDVPVRQGGGRHQAVCGAPVQRTATMAEVSIARLTWAWASSVPFW